MKISKKIKSVLFLVIIIITASCINKNSDKQKKELIIFHAGSLSVPFKQITEEFNKEYPDINVKLEAAGSRKCARKITDLNLPCDIMASADYKVIDNLLIPDFADWNIKFVSNEMSIVFNEKSLYSENINSKNWYDILLKKDVIFGRSDPNSDPCGYRAVLVTKLAEKYYNIPCLSDEFLKKDLNYIRPKEVDLISLLESNAIDYIFLYRSVAQQHKLKYIILPDEINLKNPDYKDYYSEVSVEVSGKKPGEKIIHKGEPMIYGVTILKNASNPDAAKKFMNFLLDKNKGMKIMEDNGQPSVIPAPSETFNKIPDYLKKYSKNI